MRCPLEGQQWSIPSSLFLFATILASCSQMVVDGATVNEGMGPLWNFQVDNQGETSVVVWVRPVATTTDLGEFRDGPVTKVTVKPGRKVIAAKTDASTYDESIGYILPPRLTAKGYILVIEGVPGGPVIAWGHPALPSVAVADTALLYREQLVTGEKRSRFLPEGKIFGPFPSAVLITIDPQGAVTFSLTPETLAQLVDAPVTAP